MTELAEDRCESINLLSTFYAVSNRILCMASSFDSADRRFFAEVSAAALASPFSSQRKELDARIAGGALQESERAHRLRDAVTARVTRLGKDGKAHLKHYRGEEQAVMRNVFLFESYHAHCDPLDEHIEEQLKAGDQPSAILFAREAL